MKILFVLESYYPNIGGVETLFKNLVEELAIGGHEVTVITNRTDNKAPATEHTGKILIKRYPFFNRYFFTLLAFIPAWYHARKCDLIQTTSYNAGFPAFLAGWLSGKKTFITFHEYWGKLWFDLPFFGKFSLWLHYLFESFLVKIPFHRFVAVSEYTKLRLLSAGIRPESVVRIYNGINYSEWQAPDAQPATQATGKYQFIYFGRLGISKGLDVLLNAIKHLKTESDDFLLNLVVSSKPEFLLTEVKRLIDVHALHQHVAMSHHLSLPDLVKMICASDAVVIPSYSEGFCYSAVESVALGKPIISSGRGALPEVVGGRCINLPQLDPDALCQAMKRAMANDWDTREIKLFKLNDTVLQYMEMYENSGK